MNIQEALRRNKDEVDKATMEVQREVDELNADTIRIIKYAIARQNPGSNQLGAQENPAPEPMYRDKEEVDKAIVELGEVQRRIDDINADINRRTAAIVASHEEVLTALSDEKKGLETDIRCWCEENRKDILPAGMKTARFFHGEVAWRAGRKTVEVTGDEDKFAELIRTLKKKRLSRFFYIKHVIDKTLVAREADKIKDIPGIEIKEGKETFAVRPFDMAVDKAA